MRIDKEISFYLSSVLVQTLLAEFLIVLAASQSWAFFPQTNANNIRWESASAEAWSGDFQSNTSGAVLHSAGTSDSSVDTTNSDGVTAYIGLLEPVHGAPGNTPTPTATATLTPGGPTPTPTTCVAAMTDRDYDLNEDGVIDARDLLSLIDIIETGGGNPFDLNCDGVTNETDLIEFSEKWKIEIPAGP